MDSPGSPPSTPDSPLPFCPASDPLPPPQFSALPFMTPSILKAPAGAAATPPRNTRQPQTPSPPLEKKTVRSVSEASVKRTAPVPVDTDIDIKQQAKRSCCANIEDALGSQLRKQNLLVNQFRQTIFRQHLTIATITQQNAVLESDNARLAAHNTALLALLDEAIRTIDATEEECTGLSCVLEAKLAELEAARRTIAMLAGANKAIAVAGTDSLDADDSDSCTHVFGNPYGYLDEASAIIAHEH